MFSRDDRVTDRHIFQFQTGPYRRNPFHLPPNGYIDCIDLISELLFSRKKIVQMSPVEANRKIDTQESNQHSIPHPAFGEACRFWVKLGFSSFGGPAGQISIMHHELVDRKKWVSNERFLNALNYCMLLPCPEAQQLAVYIGWLLHRLPGGVVAGAFFVIPSIFTLFALSYTYAAFGTIPSAASVFNGLKAAIMAIVVSAIINIGKKALKNGILVGIAATSFVAIFFSRFPFR